jgi:hypothetical protein
MPSQATPEPLTFDAETLPPIHPDDFSITAADIEAAVAEWEVDPPDPDYEKILDAEVID